MKLERNQIKCIAISCMVLDHVAFALVPYTSPLFHVMRFFGRCTAPIMCCLLAEGWRRTSNRRRYISRMFAFGAISYVPYVLLGHPYVMVGQGSMWQLDFDMEVTLGICLLMLAGWDWVMAKTGPGPVRWAGLGAVVAAACWLTRWCDWPIIAPLWVINAYINRDNRTVFISMFIMIGLYASYYNYVQWLAITDSWVTALVYDIYTLGFLLAIPLMNDYDGIQVRHDKANRYFFYAFYPAHIAIIDLVVYAMLRQGGY